MKFGSVARLKEVVFVLFEYEMHFLIENLGLKHHLPIHKRFEPTSDSIVTQPETLRKIFEDLGGAFIKLGQLLALRPDLVGERYSKEFEKLLTDVDPLPRETIKEIIEGIPFKQFDYKALGSASIAQVHKATLDGKIVAVKIKRPGIGLKFQEDIELMEFLAKRIKEKYNPNFVDPIEIVEEFKRYTELELSLKHEASNIRKFYDNFKNHPYVRIPKVYETYSSDDILVMDFMEGKNILSAKSNNLGIVKKITDAVYTMLFEHRFFHADLHPGNIFIHNGKIIFLDFGIVGHIDRQLEKKLFKLFSGLIDGDLEKTSEALVELNCGNDEPNEQILRNGIYDVLADFYDHPLKRTDFAKVFYGSLDVAKRAKIRLPAQIVLFGKSLVTLDGFCRQIDPDFNVVRNARPYVHRLVKKELNSGKIIKQVKAASFKMYEILLDFPDMIKSVARRISRFDQRITDIDATFRSLINTIVRVSKLLTSTILFATFFITAIILIDRIPNFHGISVMSWAFLGLSALLFFQIIVLFDRE